MWAILIVTLPTRPNAVRLRIWRALKALGCVALRDGAYLLPLESASLLEAIAAETNPAKRIALVGEVQAYVIDQGYTIPIFEEPSTHQRLRGMVDVLKAHDLRPVLYTVSGPAEARQGRQCIFVSRKNLQSHRPSYHVRLQVEWLPCRHRLLRRV